MTYIEDKTKDEKGVQNLLGFQAGMSALEAHDPLAPNAYPFSEVCLCQALLAPEPPRKHTDVSYGRDAHRWILHTQTLSSGVASVGVRRHSGKLSYSDIRDVVDRRHLSADRQHE
ncbi:hypothetical protein LR394_13800 [Kineosporia babensis]|uniref:Uncharacterized protein n=1 Tax=Kineosporia babensis TaxID=499548 RepID=A0A9X1SUQ7_9ACTN|nr:hypothetical protein [Kineosporia babensis]MCD5311980.1 hypothetical protein [Kineosporia babensis]